MGNGQSRVWVSAHFSAGCIPFYLDLEKHGKQWKISRLPEVTFHTHGIPIPVSEVEKNQNKWIILVGEDSMEISVPPAAEIKSGQPISFTALDDMLASLQPLQPIKLIKVLSLSDTVLEDKELGYFSIAGRISCFYGR
jgi:hypothetical protein